MKKLFFYLSMVLCSYHMNCIEAFTEEAVVSPALDLNATVQYQIEQTVFNLINQNRIANFLPPLVWSETIAQQARMHSLNMANKIVTFSHDGVQDRFNYLLNAFPTLTRYGENVAYNYGYSNPAQVAVSGWLKSPGHYANIMGDFNLTGVGVAKNTKGEYYFTQIFIKASQTTLQEENVEEEDLDYEEDIDESIFNGNDEEIFFESPVLIEIE